MRVLAGEQQAELDVRSREDQERTADLMEVPTIRPLMTVKETADVLRVSTRTVRRLIGAGLLRGVRLVSAGDLH